MTEEMLNITTQEMGEVQYKMSIVDGRLQTIHVEGPGMERRFYTTSPRQHELRLTYSVFGEIAYYICRFNPESVVELKQKLRGDTEFTKVLQKEIGKIFEQYKELLIS